MNDDTTSDAILAELAEGLLAGDEWQAWLAARPQAASELEIARRVRLVLAALADEAIAVPADFEARLLQRLREDATLSALLDLWLANVGRALLELIELVVGLLPAPPSPQPRPDAAV